MGNTTARELWVLRVSSHFLEWVVVSNMSLLPSILFLVHLKLPISFLDHFLSRHHKIIFHFTLHWSFKTYLSKYLPIPTPTIKTAERKSPHKCWRGYPSWLPVSSGLSVLPSLGSWEKKLPSLGPEKLPFLLSKMVTTNIHHLFLSPNHVYQKYLKF